MKLNDVYNLLYRVQRIQKEFPNSGWEDVFANGQIESKLWLIDNIKALNLNLGLTYIFGSWYGTLAHALIESKLTYKVRGFDLCQDSVDISEEFNRKFVLDSWKFKATRYDINKIRYPLNYKTLRKNGTEVRLTETPNTIINTSSEHMASEWFDNIHKGTLVVIQSNDFFKVIEHINCVNDIQELKGRFKMKYIYSGELKLQKYTRFMLIGYKV